MRFFLAIYGETNLLRNAIIKALNSNNTIQLRFLHVQLNYLKEFLVFRSNVSYRSHRLIDVTSISDIQGVQTPLSPPAQINWEYANEF